MGCEPGRRFYPWAILAVGFISLAGAGCSASYPKDSLDEAIQKLFREELGVESRSKLSGKTLYISFPIQGLISDNFELSKDVSEKLENAMLSISRIALSTNAEIDYTVLESVDRTWGVNARLIRRLQDLKDLIFWRVSKTDFDERLVLEISKEDRARGEGPDLQGGAADSGWHDLTMPEFMGRWVASRINIGSRSNPFLGVLLGIEKLTPQFDPQSRTLTLEVDRFENASSSGAATVSMNLIKSTLMDQLSSVEAKYSVQDWADRVVLRKRGGSGVLMTISREEWVNSRKEKTTQKN